MTGADYAVIAVVALSTLISVIRGFVKEALSLLSWLLASTLALTFTPKLAGLMSNAISIPSLRAAVAFVILFLVVMIVTSIVTFLIAQTLKKSGLSGTDRALGSAFGFVRGIVIVIILVMLGTLTPFSEDRWWQESTVIGYFDGVAGWLRDFLPEDLLSRASTL